MATQTKVNISLTENCY